MPLIETEGFTFNIPDEFVERGEFMAVVATTGGDYARYVLYDRGNDTWLIRWNPDDVKEPRLNNDLYGDGFLPPVFIGWEVVEEPNSGKKGDVYVCVDASQREYRKANSPSLCLGCGGIYAVDPSFGNTKPTRGWRIYRRKKHIGAVKLLPSNAFSQPLPLP